jgi:hypothetical protein
MPAKSLIENARHPWTQKDYTKPLDTSPSGGFCNATIFFSFFFQSDMHRYFHYHRLPKALILCAFALFATQACQQVRSPNAFNLYGGASRSGNYEDGGSFANTTIINDFPKKNDSLALKAAKNQVGANMPPVPISFITSYLTLLDGNAARYAGGRIEWKAPFDAVEGFCPCGCIRTGGILSGIYNEDCRSFEPN